MYSCGSFASSCRISSFDRPPLFAHSWHIFLLSIEASWVVDEIQQLECERSDLVELSTIDFPSRKGLFDEDENGPSRLHLCMHQQT